MPGFFSGHTVYDVICEVLAMKQLSIRRLAMLAHIAPTTLTSMLDRRPAHISFRTLDAIAQPFDMNWMDLFNYEDKHLPVVDSSGKVPSALAEGDFERIMERLANMLNLSQEPPRTNTARLPKTVPANNSDDFRRSIPFVLERLNDDGLMEAMRRLLDIAADPRFCKDNNPGN